ncbi:hypothetical protein BH11MYX3_BH11MYX3_45400 [soil metagenome]
MTGLGRFLIAVLLASAACTARGQVGVHSHSTATIVRGDAPPPPRQEAATLRPGFVFIHGRWDRHNRRWVWRDGYYDRERPGYVYVEGRWAPTDRGHVWVDGEWRRREGISLRDR